METTELTPRQAQLLDYIVRENVRTAGPTASRTLVERYGLDISPATVRNEMVRLEELGYLSQPHTSAGRLPTEKGFRYFVERLMQEQTLPVAERRTIAHQFYQARDRMDEWMPLAASVLAHTTQSAALVTAPRAVQATYKHLELISTHGRAVLMVLVLDGGTVEQRLLTLPQALSQAALSEAADRLNQNFSGKGVSQIRESIAELPPLEADVAGLIASLMEQMEGVPSEDIYHYGLSDLLQQPDFAEEDTSAQLVRVIEEQGLLRTVIADVLTPAVNIGGVRVLIGGEGRWDELRSCSLILSPYGIPNYARGALGVVGPIRMPYGRTISVIRFVSGVLSEMVYDIAESETDEVLTVDGWEANAPANGVSSTD
jgi:heat-inducible transcriptional repressor